MGDAPTTENKAVTETQTIIHGLIMDVALTMAIKAAEADAPWLALPIVRQLFEFIATKCIGYFDQYLELAAAFAIMDAQTNFEANQYQAAAGKLLEAQKTGDLIAIGKAKENFKTTLGRLIHSDGS